MVYVKVGSGQARLARQGELGSGLLWPGLAGKVWCVEFWCGLAGLGMAGYKKEE